MADKENLKEIVKNVYLLSRQTSRLVLGIGLVLFNVGNYVYSQDKNAVWWMLIGISVLMPIIVILRAIKYVVRLIRLPINTTKAIKLALETYKEHLPITTQYVHMIVYACITAIFIYDSYAFTTGATMNNLLLNLTLIWPICMTITTDSTLRKVFLKPKNDEKKEKDGDEKNE